jgi:YYY domain-containing protein
LREGRNLDYELQFLAVIVWLGAVFLLQLSFWPYLKKWLGDYAFPAAFPASVLTFTLISWYCGLFSLPLQLALVPFVVLFGYALWKREITWTALKREWKWVGVFLLFFVFLLEVRFVNPSISYAEKFMDHAFIASIMRTPVVPPVDPWFLGGTLDVYYYLGYWIFGALGVVTGIPSTIVFNLALPTVLGMAAVSLYALGHLLTDRFRWLPLVTLLIVNPSFIYQVIQGKGIGSILWDSTRTIPNTIQEYPLFSFLWGDVHAHVIGMFNQLFMIFLLVYAWMNWQTAGRRTRWAIVLLSALSLGAMPLINSWDVIVYAPVTVLSGLILWHRSRKNPAEMREKTPENTSGKDSGPWYHPLNWVCPGPSYLVLVPVLAVLSYLPSYFMFNTNGIMGIGLVTTPTPAFEFLLVHGLFIALFLVYLAEDIIKRPYLLLVSLPFGIAGYPGAAIAVIPLVYLLARGAKKPAELLAVIGLLIVILTEFFYFKDSMGDVYYRMNTIFKFYIAAWLLMGTSSFVMLAQMLGKLIPREKIRPVVTKIGLVIAVVVLLVCPLVVPLDSPYRDASLDGLNYLKTAHPGDAAAVDYLRSLPGSFGIVEAEGGDYTYYSRISSFTGLPTIIGMPFHEYMWRNDQSGWYGERIGDIKTIYEDPAATADLMRKYNATMIIVGDPEREKYQVRVDEAGLTEIYDRDGVQIYTLPA